MKDLQGLMKDFYARGAVATMTRDEREWFNSDGWNTFNDHQMSINESNLKMRRMYNVDLVVKGWDFKYLRSIGYYNCEIVDMILNIYAPDYDETFLTREEISMLLILRDSDYMQYYTLKKQGIARDHFKTRYEYERYEMAFFQSEKDKKYDRIHGIV